jgi:hypothetical protein
MTGNWYCHLEIITFFALFIRLEKQSKTKLFPHVILEREKIKLVICYLLTVQTKCNFKLIFLNYLLTRTKGRLIMKELLPHVWKHPVINISFGSGSYCKNVSTISNGRKINRPQLNNFFFCVPKALFG